MRGLVDRCLAVLFMCWVLVFFACHKTERIPAMANNTGISNQHDIRHVINLSRIVPLPGIPSASGMAVLNNIIYIAGDDSPFLYRLDSAFQQLPPIQLFKTTEFTSGRIPKKQKPDLEGLTTVQIKNQTYLLAIGSGSASNRTKAFLINVDAGAVKVKEVSLQNLYKELEKNHEITEGQVLNIEGITVTGQTAYLLQRGVGGKANTLIRIDKNSFIELLNGNLPENLKIETVQLALPEINEIKGGFSGIDYFDGKLFVTASVENTDNPVLDGEVLGSYIGWIDAQTGEAELMPIKAADGKILPIKAESVTVVGREKNKYKLLAVTDNDLGGSELLVIECILHDLP